MPAVQADIGGLVVPSWSRNEVGSDIANLLYTHARDRVNVRLAKRCQPHVSDPRKESSPYSANRQRVVHCGWAPVVETTPKCLAWRRGRPRYWVVGRSRTVGGMPDQTKRT